MSNWFVPFRQLQRGEALVGQRAHESKQTSNVTASYVLNLTYVNIQFTQPTSTSHLLNLASCFVSIPLSVSLPFCGCPRTFPTCLPPQFSICFSSCGCLAMEILCVLFVPASAYAGCFALGAKMLVSQYLVQFGSVHVSGACKTCFFHNILSDG